MHTPNIDSEDCLEWSTHAVERKNERNIDLDITKLSKKHVLSLPYYFSQGCYHFQDTKKKNQWKKKETKCVKKSHLLNRA